METEVSRGTVIGVTVLAVGTVVCLALGIATCSLVKVAFKTAKKRKKKKK